MAHHPGWTAGVALAIVAFSAATPLRATDEHRVALDRLAGGLWTLRVNLVPGSRTLALLVDTGAERTVLSRAAAARAGLVVSDGAHLGTPAGIVGAGQARVPALTIGGRTLSDVEVLVADLRALGRGARVDGILGMDLLVARDVVFDFDRALLTLSNGAAKTSPAGVALSMRLQRGRPVVEARVDGRTRALVLDTGAETLVLFDSLPRGRPMLFGSAGAGGVGRLARAEVAVGAAQLGDLPVLYVTAAATRVGSDGVLPTTAFSRLHIDRDASLVHVIPRRGQ